MEGGAASVVSFLIEAAAGAGVRDSIAGGSGGRRGGGGGGGAGGAAGGGGTAGYFDATVRFVSGVANTRLARLVNRRGGRGAGHQQEEAEEEQEEACLSLLQGLSGFGAPSA